MQALRETRPREAVAATRQARGRAFAGDSPGRIPGVEIIGHLGSGGFSEVYLGLESQLSRRVAVKVFSEGSDRSRVCSFEREATALGRLSGVRNVLQAHRAGHTTRGTPYLVLELLGPPVAVVRDRGPSSAATIRTGVLVARALAAAHGVGILHCDLKPANILVDRYGEPTLTDFGIAALAGTDEGPLAESFTAEHAAPERFEGERVDAASDVYSLASTLYEFAEGHPPHQLQPGGGPLEYMRRIQCSTCPPSLAALDACPPLNEILMAALARDPRDRPTLDWFTGALAGDGCRVARRRTGHGLSVERTGVRGR